MAEMSNDRINEIFMKNNIIDEDLIKAIAEIITESNRNYAKDDGKASFG